jgi:hypothetical protein
MAFVFDNCLTLNGDGINYMYGDCCCEFNCTVTTTEPVVLDSLTGGFVNELFGLSSGPKIYIAGIPQTLPLVLAPNDTFEIQMEICASGAENDDQLKLTFVDIFFNQTDFLFDFLAIDLSTSVNPTSFAFGNVNVGQTGTLEFKIENPTIGCCYGYNISTTCPQFVITPDVSNTICPGEKQSGFKLDWSPSAVGPINCTITVTTDCQTYDFPVTGNAITPPEPPSGGGGNSVSGKRTVVDCPTSDCRLANGQPGFAQTTKNSINQISRVTRPKGGAGRGTNFR